jgi:1-deoxy-D-xylulose-5-phosphate reductoisomerase
MKLRHISILGSTGSIGCNTLNVVDAFGDHFHVVALAAGRNVAQLVEQIARYRPQLVSVETEEGAEELRAELREQNIAAPRILTGEAGTN